MKIEQEIIKFAKEHNIDAIFEGHDPEEGTFKTYYLLKINYRFDSKLENKVSTLNLDLYRRTKQSFNIMCWPVDSIKDAENYGFMKEQIYP